MTFFAVLFFSVLSFVPSDVKAALDNLTFFRNVQLEFVRHSDSPGMIPRARTFYMRNERGQELVISEATFNDDGRRIANRVLMKDGLAAMSLDLAPTFQVIPSAEMGTRAGVSPQLLRGGGTLSGQGHVPTLQSFHLRGKLEQENVQQVTMEEHGDKEVYHILTNLRHLAGQEGSSVFSFTYDQVSGRIVETWIDTDERCHIEYDADGRITKLSTVFDGQPELSRSWDIESLSTVTVPQELQWRWIGFVPGAQVVVTMPEHHTHGQPARWTGEDIVTRQEYHDLAVAGQVITDPEYYRMMAEFMAIEEGKTHLTFERGMEAFELQVAQSSLDRVLTPWEHVTQKFCEEFSLTDGERNQAKKVLDEATDRLKKIAPNYNEKRPEVVLTTLMTFSQREINENELTQSTKTDQKKAEALRKARDLFLRFWEQLRKGHAEDKRMETWDKRFGYQS